MKTSALEIWRAVRQCDNTSIYEHFVLYNGLCMEKEKNPENESSHNSALLDSARLRGCSIKSVFYECDGEMTLWGCLMVTDASPAEFSPRLSIPLFITLMCCSSLSSSCRTSNCFSTDSCWKSARSIWKQRESKMMMCWLLSISACKHEPENSSICGCKKEKAQKFPWSSGLIWTWSKFKDAAVL